MSQSQTNTAPKALLSAAHPAFIGGVAGALFGLGMMGFALYLAFATNRPMPLYIAVFVVGSANLAASVFTVRAVRVAWAFALSINGTGALVFLFASPRIRDAMDVSIGYALIPCAVSFVITILHALESEDF